MKSPFARLPNLVTLIRGHFFSGLLIVIPIGVIAWILGAALGALWRLHEFLPESWQPEKFLDDGNLAFLINLAFTVGSALVLAMGLSVLGWVSKQFLGQKLLELVAEIIQRIPVVRS